MSETVIRTRRGCDGRWRPVVVLGVERLRLLQKRAHSLVSRLRKTGALVPPERCESCRRLNWTSPLHAHHDDYERPADVRWLCAPCHAKHHAKLARAARRQRQRDSTDLFV